MNRSSIHAFVRSIQPARENDSIVLERIRNRNDHHAFAQIVNRYGRLVWSACQHLSRCEADAEDAFQATFILLSQKANTIQKVDSLGAWLYGVAYRICSKARRSTQRRVKREQNGSRTESSRVIPDSVWDRALAAVHEEVNQLPESLRVPFVMCCLEGIATTEAAEKLGLKLGTFSGRLTRAKDILIAKLEKRGLTAGALASAAIISSTSTTPASLIQQTISISTAETIPNTLFILMQGVTEMSTIRTKLLAAAVLLACGIGSGMSGIWKANAQQLQKVDPSAQKAKEPDRPVLPHEYVDVFDKNATSRIYDPRAPQPYPPKWEYHFDRKPVGYAPTTEKLKSALLVNESNGWEFVGMLNTSGENPGDPILPTLVYRRPIQLYKTVFDSAVARLTYLDQSNRQEAANRSSYDAAQEKIRALEAELTALKAKAQKAQIEARYLQKDLPLGMSETQDILNRVAQKIGVKNLVVVINPADGGSLILEGDRESVDWARTCIQSLSGKKKEQVDR